MKCCFFPKEKILHFFTLLKSIYVILGVSEVPLELSYTPEVRLEFSYTPEVRLLNKSVY